MSRNDLDSMIDSLMQNHKSKTKPTEIDVGNKAPLVLKIDVSAIERDCLYKCGSIGIPILPVVFSKQDYKLNSNDERHFTHSLSNKSSQHSALAALPTNAYLYSYVESDYGNGNIYDKLIEYFTGNDGSLRVSHEYSVSELKEDSIQDGIQLSSYKSEAIDDNGSQSFNCTRAQHNTLASKYIVLGIYDTVWIMVSQVRLSNDVLRKYVIDNDLREKRMQKFVAQDLISNQNTQVISNRETSYIKSFHRRKQLAKGDDIDARMSIQEQAALSTRKEVGEDLKYIRKSQDSPNNSEKVAKALYDRMEHGINEEVEYLEDLLKIHDNSTDRQKLAFYKTVKPMMVALHDPVGEVLAAAEKRNYLLKKLDDAQKNKGQIREQVNAIIIDNIKSSVEAANQSSVHEQQGYSRAGLNRNRKANAAVGRNVYNYINESKFKAVLATAKKSRKDKAAIAAARQTFIDAIKRSEFAFVMREDFPENDEESHLGYAQIIAEAIQGIGIDESNIGMPDAIWADYKPEQTAGITAKQEFEQTLLPCISGQQPTEDNWLAKALIGLNKADLNRMLNPPTYENLARTSDFIGTTTSWVVAFKAKKQQQQIKVNIARDIEKLNTLVNHKAQILQTMSSNMSHIKDNNKWLYMADMWQRASVHQSTGFKLAQVVLNLTPEGILEWGEQRLGRSIDNAKPHSTLLPASVDSKAVGNASSVKVPIAIDLVSSHGVAQTAVDIFDNAASGNEYARTVVTMYGGEESARVAATINQDIDKQTAKLNTALDPINGEYRKLERNSAGKAALVSAGIALFQLRSIWMGKNNIGTMAARGDRLGLEFMTGYASTTLALTSASLDVANAGLQMKVARNVWSARLSLSVGVLGAVGAGFEVYSLSISLVRQLESKSKVSTIGTGVAMISAGAAGIASLAIGFGFVMPWVIGIMAVAWAVSLIAQWIAFTYDKSHILPIHYWLDAGVFGNKAMLNSEYPNNPFKIQAMGSLEQDMHAYSLALTEIQVNPSFTTSTADFRQTLSGQIEVTLSQWNDDSEIVVEFIGISSQERGLDRKSFNIKTLKRQNKAIETSKVLQVTLDIPKTSHFQAHYLGSYQAGTRNPNEVQKMQEAREIAQANAGREIDKLRAVVKYALNPSKNPYYQLRTSITSQ